MLATGLVSFLKNGSLEINSETGILAESLECHTGVSIVIFPANHMFLIWTGEYGPSFLLCLYRYISVSWFTLWLTAGVKWLWGFWGLRGSWDSFLKLAGAGEPSLPVPQFQHKSKLSSLDSLHLVHFHIKRLSLANVKECILWFFRQTCQSQKRPIQFSLTSVGKGLGTTV